MREIRITSGWPSDEKLNSSDPTLRRDSAECWVIFYIKNGQAQQATIVHEWSDLTMYAHRWLYGCSLEEIEK